MRLKAAGAVIALSLILAGCTANSLEIDVACETATSALTIVTVLKAQGKLQPDQIASVDNAVSVIDPICGAPTRPTGAEALSKIQGAVLTISGVNTAAGGN